MLLDKFQEVGKFLNQVVPAPGLGNIRNFAQAATHLESLATIAFELLEDKKRLEDEIEKLKAVIKEIKGESDEPPANTL